MENLILYLAWSNVLVSVMGVAMVVLLSWRVSFVLKHLNLRYVETKAEAITRWVVVMVLVLAPFIVAIAVTNQAIRIAR